MVPADSQPCDATVIIYSSSHPSFVQQRRFSIIITQFYLLYNALFYVFFIYSLTLSINKEKENNSKRQQWSEVLFFVK